MIDLLKNKTFLLLLKAALALGVLGYLVYAIEPDRLWEAARTAHPGWIGAAAALLPLNLLLEGLTWRKVLRPVAPRASNRALAGALLCGHALGLVTPMRAGDFAGRAFYLRYTDRWTAGLTVFAQRLLEMVAALTVGLLALAYAMRTSLLTSPLWWGAAIYGSSVALLLAVLLLRPAGTLRLLRRLTSSRKILDRLAFLERLRPPRMFGALALATLRYACFVTQLVFLLRAFAPDLPFRLAYLGAALTYLAKFLIPAVTALDLGIREGAAVFFFSRLGVGAADAFNAAFLLFLVNLLLPALFGLPFVLRLQLGRRTADGRPPLEQPALSDP